MSVKELEKYIKETLEPRIAALEGENKILADKIETLEEGQETIEKLVNENEPPEMSVEDLSGTVANNVERLNNIEAKVGTGPRTGPKKIERGVPTQTFKVDGVEYRFLYAIGVVRDPETGRTRRLEFAKIFDRPDDLAFVVKHAPGMVEVVEKTK